MTDIATIVEQLDAFGLIRKAQVRGQWYSIYCPYHSDGQEKKPSCGISLVDEYRAGRHYRSGTLHCFACGAVKSLPELVDDMIKIHNIDQASRDWLTENIAGYDADNSDFEKLIPDELSESVENRFALQSILTASFYQRKAFVSEEELASYRYTVPYMYERKLTDELIEKFDIGVDMNFVPPGRKRALPCITFPVRDIQGRTLFLCRRSIEGKFFNYPQGITKPVYGIYELPKDCKRVYICESCFNALTCWRYGEYAVALLGTGNATQVQQLKQLGVTEFVIALDPDEAGHKGTQKLMKALSSVAIVWVLTGIPEGKDINDLTEEEFRALELE